MKQTKEELEAGYDTPDPWGYQINQDDLARKNIILTVLDLFLPVETEPISYRRLFSSGLDIGCGEGWITKNLPVTWKHLYGYEISDKAAARFPSNVQRVHISTYKTLDTLSETIEACELVTAMGCLYREYEWEHFINLINNHSSNIILTCNIKDRETGIEFIKATQIFEAEFPYREFTQKLRVFKK